MPSREISLHDKLVMQIQALALISYGISILDVSHTLQISSSTLYNIQKRAKDCGFDPKNDPQISLSYMEDAPRSGQPKKISTKEAGIIASVTKSHSGREKSTEILAFEAGISYLSVLQILKKHDFVIAKPTWKPGLTESARKKRLRFCLAHKNWTLEDWKNVIWTDETSVVLGHRREAVYKKSSDFMFWGCFMYKKKGPCHI
uniref:Transposase Tc1-like domain-containing protein n=1 Tax=Coccidioides posadasii RMSCC 3488 TaxID=454284 RepID=A0A0J6F4F8_COCPO|nr:hypothetical protein CPAG_00492 [Coccidioides posadasii RMSCC 3488]